MLSLINLGEMEARVWGSVMLGWMKGVGLKLEGKGGREQLWPGFDLKGLSQAGVLPPV